MGNPIKDLWRNATFGVRLIKVLRQVKDLQPDSTETIADDFEATVDRDPSKSAFVFEGATVSYGEFDARANRIAHWALAQGFKPGDAVALILENCPDYPAVWFGLAKVGVISALINTNLDGAGLTHCISIVDANAIIASGVQAERAKAVLPQLSNAPKLWDFDAKAGEDLEAALASQPDTRPDRSVRADLRGGDSALFVYTSGTTGLPKAAKITHMRVRMTARASKFLADINDKDRIYNVLPLYHMTGGCMGTAGPLTYGATLILRRKLSVSGFWDDVAEYDANKFVYIGELCRYLINADAHPKERAHNLEMGFGNGLRGEVWRPFVERFDVGTMREFYGSTEGNVSFFNFDGTIGAIGQLPEWAGRKMGTAIVKFDIVEEKPVRGNDGFCVRAGVNEPGEVLGRIGTSSREDFGGYHDKKATEAKILTDVFEKGDRWFRTGDLIRRDEEDYIYFIDRIGDTFRWKGENVATNEVSDVISSYPGVDLANVFGVEVPGAEGRAGMVAMTVTGEFKVEDLATYLSQQLPHYAVPLFLRIQPEAETTGTFKFRKVDLVKDGFDPNQVSDPLWFLDPGTGQYVTLDADCFRRIEQGEYRL